MYSLVSLSHLCHSVQTAFQMGVQEFEPLLLMTIMLSGTC